MKKSLFAVISFVLISLLIFTTVSCSAPPADSTSAVNETETDTEKTKADTLAQLITAEITEQEDKSTAKEETDTENVPESGTVTDAEDEGTDKEERENSVYLLYKTAAEKTNSLKDMRQITQTEQRIKISLPGGGQMTSLASESSDISISGNKCKGKDSLRVESDGQISNTDHEFYADKEKIYLKNTSGGYTAYDKTASEVKAINALLSKEIIYIPVLSEDVFDNAAVTENGDGTKTIKAHPSDGTANTALKNTNSQLDTVIIALGAENTEYGAGDSEYTFTVSKDGYITSISVKTSVEISMNIAGVSVKAVSEAAAVCEIIEPGQTVTVEIPELD